MAKERIVIETTNHRKTALAKKLELQGESFSDWLEEQLTLSMPNEGRDELSGAPTIRMQERDFPATVLSRLSAQDWAFTDERTGYLTHDLHPYPAKFIPQIPAHLIAHLSDPGDVVLDPFGGSGTTAVEAVRMGRRAVSIDANPLSGLIGRVKTGCMSASVRQCLDQLKATVESYIVSPAFKKATWAEQTAAKYARYVPDIPNIEKWFAPTAVAELAVIRHLIDETSEGLAVDAALLAMSRIILRVSYQDSETRYVASDKAIERGLTLRAFLESLKTIGKRLEHVAPNLQRVDARFIVGDSRTDVAAQVGNCSVDLIVTSPPYPNATDYHLYHRFRLFWLGFDPRSLGHVEIGSHLRHQRNGTGFEEYHDDMQKVMEECYIVLKPGGYAVFVVGDAVFKGKTFSTAGAIATAAQEAGFEYVGKVDRAIHLTKRSFVAAARRARTEQLVVLRKPPNKVVVSLMPPAYRMWDYEVALRKLETEAIFGKTRGDYTGEIRLKATPKQLASIRKLTFTKDYLIGGKSASPQPTWQKILENGDGSAAKRKDPKYVTHGVHPYKGKFYPQLAKALMNVLGVQDGARILDPFCGSGTVLLEGMLNGYATYGCDFNPLAAKIARAKTGILSVDREVGEHALVSLVARLKRLPKSFPTTRNEFAEEVRDELAAWFAEPVLDKIEWVLSQSRLFGDPRIVEFCEVIVSSVIRDVSQQDPTDLRIRRRKEALLDAPVIELVVDRLETQLQRLLKYWTVAGRQPGERIASVVQAGDSRHPGTFAKMGLQGGTVDCVVTSPPYATALPYIDTDRLSLMAIMGINSSTRSDLEVNLTGSREIKRKVKTTFEEQLLGSSASADLPQPVVTALRAILKANRSEDVGFRRDNMAALLWRYFIDMRQNLLAVQHVLRAGGTAFYVVGDSKTKAGGSWQTIETCNHIAAIGAFVGLEADRLMDISVTTENYKHIKNAITENAVIRFRRA